MPGKVLGSETTFLFGGNDKKIGTFKAFFC